MSRQKALTQERLFELLSYSKKTGVFHWKIRASAQRPAGSVAGAKKGARGVYRYLYTRIDGVDHQLHRLAVLYVTGAHPVDQVEHKNGNGFDNRWENLRHATPTLNSENRRKSHNGRVDDKLPMGVDWREKDQKYVARIRVAGKLIHLGFHRSSVEASRAYLRAKRKLHKGCTI